MFTANTCAGGIKFKLTKDKSESYTLPDEELYSQKENQVLV